MGIWEIGGELLDKKLKEYMDKILRLYKRNKIILHKAYMVDRYVSKYCVWGGTLTKVL